MGAGSSVAVSVRTFPWVMTSWGGEGAGWSAVAALSLPAAELAALESAWIWAWWSAEPVDVPRGTTTAPPALITTSNNNC